MFERQPASASQPPAASAAERAMFAPRPFGTESDLVRPKPDTPKTDTPPAVQPQTAPTRPPVNILTKPLHAAWRYGTPPVQTKLTVGQPGDQYEQEADRTAAQVMRMPDPQAESESIAPPMAQPKLSVQAKGNGTETNQEIESQLSQSKGGGSPLPEQVRSFMEPRFGSSFEHVRVHTDGNAVQMNQALGAQAFTHGSDIYYGAGKSPAVSDLTAHELTHVVQQTGGTQAKPIDQPTVQPKCAECAEEETVQRSVDISSTAQPSIQQWWGNEEETESESDSGGGVVSWFKEKIGGAVDSAVETGGAVVDWTKEKGGAALETAAQVGGEVVDSVTQQGSAALDAVKQVRSDAADLAKEKGSAAVDSVRQVGGEAVDWVKEKGGKASELLAVDDLDDKVIQTLTQLKEMLVDYTPLPEGLQKLYEELSAEKEQLEASTDEVLQQSYADDIMQQVSGNKDADRDFSDWGGSAGDCGLCLGYKQAGNVAHKQVQSQFYAENPSAEAEFQIRINSILRGRVDLAIKDDYRKRIEIGEIKPANNQNAAVGMEQLLEYVDLLKVAFPDYTVAPLTKPIQNQPLTFLTGSMNCPVQQLRVRSSSLGLYFYSCTPTYAELKAQGCKCDSTLPIPVPVDQKQEADEKKKEKIRQLAKALVITVALIGAINVLLAPVPEPTHKIAASITAIALATSLLVVMRELRQQTNTSA